MKKLVLAFLAILIIQFGANAQAPMLGDTVILQAQFLNDDVHFTIDHDALRDTLDALSVLEGRTIGGGVTSHLSLWDSVQAVAGPATMIITASEVSDGDTSNDAALSMTFTSDKRTNDFTVGDITVNNGAISAFGGTDKTYIATFTPTGDGVCTIDVAADAFSNLAGTGNEAADQFNWTYDGTAPTMTITASEVSDGASSSDATLSLTFTSSESTTDFEEADITVTNGALSAFAGSGTTYTATFTPSGDGACTINVAGSSYTDAAGNNNTAADEFNWTKTTPSSMVYSWHQEYSYPPPGTFQVVPNYPDPIFWGQMIFGVSDITEWNALDEYGTVTITQNGVTATASCESAWTSTHPSIGLPPESYVACTDDLIMTNVSGNFDQTLPVYVTID